MSAGPVPRPLVPLPARLGVLLSGRGSNFEALADACARGDLPARVAVVLSDVADAPGLERARERGIEALARPRSSFPSRAAFEDAVHGDLAGRSVDLVCLAGFMRLLSPGFVARWPSRILNVHPSLLPAFPGLDAPGQAVRYGARVSGVTVHLVDAGMDTGPIVLQVAAPVEPGDDAASLAARLLPVEHRAFPAALRMVLLGGWTLEGRSFRPG